MGKSCLIKRFCEERVRGSTAVDDALTDARRSYDLCIQSKVAGDAMNGDIVCFTRRICLLPSSFHPHHDMKSRLGTTLDHEHANTNAYGCGEPPIKLFPRIETALSSKATHPKRARSTTLAEECSPLTTQFVSKYISTIGIDYGVKPVKVNGESVRINFWDLSGHPDFFEIRNEFYKDSQGVSAAPKILSEQLCTGQSNFTLGAYPSRIQLGK